MKTKADGVARAFEPYDQSEIDLILSLVPTTINVKRLAKTMGRSEEAIQMLYNHAYSGQWLKRQLGEMADHQSNVLTKIAKSKKRFGITIGFQP